MDSLHHGEQGFATYPAPLLSPPFAGPRGHFCSFSLHVTDSEPRRPSHHCFSSEFLELGVGDQIYRDWNVRGSQTSRGVGTRHPP